MNALENIPEGVTSTETPLLSMRYSFVVGAGCFVVFFFLCRSNGSNWGIGSARKAIAILRGVVFTEIVCICILLYFYIENGRPISYHSALKFGNGDDWLFSYPRPVAGIFLIGSGMFADMHPFLRYMCCAGCIVQILGDSLSSYQIYDYKNQVSRLNAPSNGYTIYTLTIYYWRDIVSISLATCILFLTLYLVAMLGFILPQLIHPSIISGRNYNRFEVMHSGRSKRKFMESTNTISSLPPPLVPRKTLQMRIEEQFRQRQLEHLSSKHIKDEQSEEKSVHKENPTEQFIV
jgi:hypothetical protein